MQHPVQLGLSLNGIGIGVSNLIVYEAEAKCPAGKVAVGGGGQTGTLAGSGDIRPE